MPLFVLPLTVKVTGQMDQPLQWQHGWGLSQDGESATSVCRHVLQSSWCARPVSMQQQYTPGMTCLLDHTWPKALAESYTEHIKHTQAKNHDSKGLLSDKYENCTYHGPRWHCRTEFQCLNLASLPMPTLHIRYQRSLIYMCMTELQVAYPEHKKLLIYSSTVVIIRLCLIQQKYVFLNSVFNALYNAFCFTKIDQNLTKIQLFKSKLILSNT